MPTRLDRPVASPAYTPFSISARFGQDGTRHAPLRALVVTPIYPWAGNPNEGIFVHRQVLALRAAGVHCRVLMFRPAVRGLDGALCKLSWLRYHPRWLVWPERLDEVLVEFLFHRAPERRGDPIPHAREAVIRHLEADPTFGEIDIVIGHWLWQGGAVALATGEALGRPVVAVARGSDLHAWLELHAGCRGHVLDVLARADCLVANCESHRRRMEVLLPGAAERTAVIYNGCDTDRFPRPADPGALRRELGLPVDHRLLLYCGRVQRSKGMYDLAEAWERGSDAMRGWELVVVGPLVERAAVARLQQAAERSGRSVRIVGAVGAEHVARYMGACDALVHPSHAEGLANVTVEAMATGLPVISAAVDGQPELVEQGRSGWLVPPRDVDALCAALAELAADPVAARLRGVRARERVRQHFDAATHGARFASLLAATSDRGAHSSAGVALRAALQPG